MKSLNIIFLQNEIVEHNAISSSFPFVPIANLQQLIVYCLFCFIRFFLYVHIWKCSSKKKIRQRNINYSNDRSFSQNEHFLIVCSMGTIRKCCREGKAFLDKVRPFSPCQFPTCKANFAFTKNDPIVFWGVVYFESVFSSVFGIRISFFTFSKILMCRFSSNVLAPTRANCILTNYLTSWFSFDG